MLNQNRKSLRLIFAAFAALCAVSLYRQQSLARLPEDPVRPVIVCAVYLCLLALWGRTISQRFTQRAVLYLLAESAVMAFWIILRFLQEAAFSQSLYLLRVSGYFVAFPAVLLPLLGLYAALCLGNGDDFRLPAKWHLLLISASALIALTLASEQLHFIFRPPLASNPLTFPPGAGFYLLLLWAAALYLARIALLYSRTSVLREHPVLRFAPFVISAAVPLTTVPYILHAFVPIPELLELTAQIFFLEVMVWESCLLLGIVNVNTQYERVFELSSVGMQILSENGTPLMRSRQSVQIRPAQFQKLLEACVITDTADTELRLHAISKGYFVWQNDISTVQAIIRNLQKSTSDLQQENEILARELNVRSEEARVRARNDIYNRLSAEVDGQLRLLRGLLREPEPAKIPAGDLAREPARNPASDPVARLRKVSLIGTYVKRRCNLRLIEQSAGIIPFEDLVFSLRDLFACMDQLGIETELHCSRAEYSSEFSLFIFDALELLLEHEKLEPRAVRMAIESEGTVWIDVTPAKISAAGAAADASVLESGAAAAGAPASFLPPMAEIDSLRRDGCYMDLQMRDGGYSLLLAERPLVQASASAAT